MNDLDQRLQCAWARLSVEKRLLIIPLLESMAEDTTDENILSPLEPANNRNMIAESGARISRYAVSSPSSTYNAHSCSGSRDESVHALLKLGFARGHSGRQIRPSQTLASLDNAFLEGAPPLYLGTNSQAVSDRFKPLIKVLYILSDEDTDGSPQADRIKSIRRVVEVSAVLNQWEFEDVRRSAQVSICPEEMESARTWFKVERVWKVKHCPPVEDIRLLKTGESIAHAVSAGRATFFYVRPVDGLEVAE